MAVQGLDALKAKIAKIPQAARAELAKELDRSANDIASLARGLAPMDHGALKNSIHVEPGRTELSRKVIAGDEIAYYARWVEFGHGHAKARPFFFPAYRALRRAIKVRIGRAYTKAAKAVASSGGSSE